MLMSTGEGFTSPIKALAQAYLITAAVRARGPPGIKTSANTGTRGHVLENLEGRGKGHAIHFDCAVCSRH
jgi:hypothetical protein